MIPQPVTVPGQIVFIYSTKFLANLQNQPTPFFQEVDSLARRGMLPVTLETTQKGWRMAIYAGRHVAWLYPTQAGDAYNLGHASRRQFRDEERLLKGALFLRCGGIYAFPDLRAFNQAIRDRRLPRTATYEQVLWNAWRAVTAPAATPESPPPVHARYLDLLEMVVEASRQIEFDKQTAIPPQHYTHCEPAKEQRYSARGVYRFRMARRAELATNTMVCLGDLPEMRGRVIRVDGRDLTVRFEPGSDFDDITPQGTLRVLPGDRIFRAQLDAIAQLRKGKTLNPRLLDNLRSAVFAPYQPAADATPKVDLDPDQRRAFQRAITVADILTVLGPPGAGKTTTIIEVVQACVARGQRVLITSHTHRAVDNVLEDLPPDLNVVRIGSEDRMSSKVKAMSSESRVETVRAEILADTTLFDALSQVQQHRPLLDRYLAHLRSTIEQTQAAQAELERVEPMIVEAVKHASGPLRPQLDDAERLRDHDRSVAVRHEASLARAARRFEAANARAHSGSSLAFVHRWLASWHRGRAEKLNQALAQAKAALAAAESRFAALWQQAMSIAGRDPHVLQLTSARDSARKLLADSWPEITRHGELIQHILRPATAMPPLPQPTVAGWTAFHQWCVAMLGTVERRAALLGKWREKINDIGLELEREVARYADVVGATCIGTDTSALISQLEFDLAIVDEAGQISTPNLLVPLVRSRRAMLVGDHMQLPPFLDEEVKRWAEGLAAGTGLSEQEIPMVAEFLAKSEFELLLPRAPEPNSVWLKTQRRMPIEIAGFVSDTFYSGQLKTKHAGGSPNSLFRSPFAMVDTSDRSPAQRAETAMRGRREAIRHGYRNELEADIIVGLVRVLEPQYRDWAVIVPFNAQRELVIKRLTAAMGASSRIDDNVGSVDSFQGGERDLIIFGFTRSNPNGDIGFLREVRRFNVAITRAKQQLVLVGDLDTLRVAKNQQFRDIMHSMSRHLARAGDRRPSLEIATTLNAMIGQPS